MRELQMLCVKLPLRNAGSGGNFFGNQPFGGNLPGNHVFGNRRFAGNLYGNLPIGNRFFRLPELVTIVGYPCWYPSHPCRFGGYQRGYLEFGYYLTVLTLLITSTPQELS